VQIDTLITARWIIPVEPERTVLEDHAIAVHKGRILEIIPQAIALTHYSANAIVDLPEHALIPGLINTHTHAAMSLFRGLADDLALMNWLTQHIWPAEQRWVSPDFVRDGTRHAIAEMIRGGTTCFNDMYFFPNQTAAVASEAGIRACVGLIVIDFPTAWASDTDAYFGKAAEVHDEYRQHPLIQTAFAPHAPYTVNDAALAKVAALAEELDLMIHMHVHETAHEVRTAYTDTGNSPLQRLQSLGLLSPRLQAVHMTQLTDREREQVAEHGVHVVHCPHSNMKLASGFCPIHALMQAGVNVALGTDGAASNNSLDMFAEMRSAALLAKAVSGDPTAVPAACALRMATLNGARALGIDALTGSLRTGKAADIVAVELGGLATQPIYDPISQLVYATNRDCVSDVWVAGQRLLQDHSLTTLDADPIKRRSTEWAMRIAEAKVAAD
jgi:5-methylthioadenosine/S-adenosylhomocysteine deaminase